MRVGGYWLSVAILAVINLAWPRPTLSDTAHALFLIAAWTFFGLWAEARARRKAAGGGR